MQKLRAIFGGFSPIALTALFAILVLVTVTGSRLLALVRPPVVLNTVAAAETPSSSVEAGTPEWQQEMLLLGLTDATDASAATSSDHLAMIGPMISGELLGAYSAILEKGNFTTDDLRNAGTQIAASMKAAVGYDAFEISDFNIDPNSSKARVATYRDALLNALDPISSIPRAEFEIYGQYVETNDEAYLQQLKDASNAYRVAALNASSVPVPQELVNSHRNLLNSFRGFAAVLDGLANHGDDPYASIALLGTYNQKEKDIHDAYEALRAIFADKGL